jgi:hypothetical protein|tara:strand:+ start:6342 stop:7436 length:1095 start_codon:yes stop_codon:yes gene_type:complete
VNDSLDNGKKRNARKEKATEKVLATKKKTAKKKAGPYPAPVPIPAAGASGEPPPARQTPTGAREEEQVPPSSLPHLLPLSILSLGAGVQSSAVLLMSCRGILPRLDAAIFADTQDEPAEVYENLQFLIAEAARHGIPVHVRTAGNIANDLQRSRLRQEEYSKVENGRWASIPFYTRDAATGHIGMLKRQCTKEYKIEVVLHFLRREILGLRRYQHAPKEHCIDHWYGMSADETNRVRISRHKWESNVYPLCGLPTDMLPKPMARWDCEDWLAEHYPGRKFPRSACRVCPYRSPSEWRHLKENCPDDWAKAVEMDRQIRQLGGMRGQTYLHPSCQPLDQADLRDLDDRRGQLSLFRLECSGVCGV